jgi:hypothetical protein
MKTKFKRTISSPITGIVTVMAIVLLAMPCAALAAKDNPGKPGGETAGNNLSFPVIWAEGVGKCFPVKPEWILLPTASGGTGGA